MLHLVRLCQAAALAIALGVSLGGCSDQPRLPSDAEVKEYEQQMQQAIQQEARQQRPPEAP
jgi:hypothetical protein